jgi:hypothetical protein
MTDQRGLFDVDGRLRELSAKGDVRIPISTGRVFRRDVGGDSEMKPATVPG